MGDTEVMLGEDNQILPPESRLPKGQPNDIRPEQPHQHFMMLARVALGRVCWIQITVKHLEAPPPHCDSLMILPGRVWRFDPHARSSEPGSSTNRGGGRYTPYLQKHVEFVVFRPQQIFPEYFFSYTISPPTGVKEVPVRHDSVHPAAPARSPGPLKSRHESRHESSESKSESKSIPQRHESIPVEAGYRFLPFSFDPARCPSTAAISSEIQAYNRECMEAIFSQG